MAYSGVQNIGTTVKPDGITRRFYLENCDDEGDVYSFIAGLSATVEGFPYTDFSAEEEGIANDYTVTVEYGSPSGSSAQQQAEATVEYKFNFQAPSAKIYQSLATIDSETAGAGTAADYDGSINVVNDGGKDRVEGVQLAPPPETFTLTYADLPSVIDGTYQQLVEGMCGHVNSATFRGRPAGSLLLARVTGGYNQSGLWNIDFGFSYIANETSLSVGDNITIDAKDGHDLLWVYYGPIPDAAANQIVKRPLHAYIERVWPRANFNSLSLPS